MATSLTKVGIKFVVLLLILTAAASCGRRGALEAPSSAGIDGMHTKETDAEEGKDRTIPADASVKEDKPFILDPLL